MDEKIKIELTRRELFNLTTLLKSMQNMVEEERRRVEERHPFFKTEKDTHELKQLDDGLENLQELIDLLLG